MHMFLASGVFAVSGLYVPRTEISENRMGPRAYVDEVKKDTDGPYL
jgi:hypothetical protein